jgi:branched-chain amino acid transport system substrate-binding protein
VIGASTPLTGPVSHYGQHARWGAEMAVAEANAKGGVNGRKIEIDFQDNRCNPAEAVKSVTQMLSSKKYAAIFDGLCSSAALAIMPLVERAKVPFIVANASATSIAEKSGVGGNKWTFKVNPTDASMLDALVAWLDKEGKADNIAFLGEDTDYGRAGSAGFESALVKRGKKLVMADYFQKGTADYTAVLTKIKANKPGMVAFYLIDADFQNGIKQWFTMGGGIPLTGRVLVEQVPKEILASGFLDGTTSVQPYDVSVDTPANKAFVEAFTKRNSEAPMLISFESYETINILIEAIRQSGDASPEKIRDALTGTKYQSMLGPVLEFDKNNLIHNDAIIFGIKGGKVVILGMSKT